jgi:Trk-type K+ transport system membrane component
MIVYLIGSLNDKILLLLLLLLLLLIIIIILHFVVNNMDSYQFISDIHSRNTRQVYNLNLYQTSADLSLPQEGVCYMGIKVLNNVPVYIKQPR